MKPGSPALQVDSLRAELPGKSHSIAGKKVTQKASKQRRKNPDSEISLSKVHNFPFHAAAASKLNF